MCFHNRLQSQGFSEPGENKASQIKKGSVRKYQAKAGYSSEEFVVKMLDKVGLAYIITIILISR